MTEANDTLSQLVNNMGIDLLGNDLNVKLEKPSPSGSEDGFNDIDEHVPLNTEELENIFVGILDNNASINPTDKVQTNASAKGTRQPIPAYTQPYLKILEEPGDTRFRFKTEGRGTLHGINTSRDRKIYPAVQIVGYNGPAKLLVSCVESAEPYRAHPHQIIGKECKEGVCILTIKSSNEPIAFHNLGVQRVKVKEITESLQVREKQNIDPFNQGFEHMRNAKTINLHDMRLCFQAYLGSRESGFTPIDPVLSRIVRNKEPNSDLQIVNYSDHTSPVKGGKKLLLFCGQIKKDDIEIHFELFTKGNDRVILKGAFVPEDIHKQCAIACRTPPFPNQYITEPVKVNLLLYKPSDKTSSDPVEFWYEPTVTTPHLFHGSPVAGETFKTPKKRPKERAAPDEASTGRINVPTTRTKGQDGESISEYAKQGSFVDQIMAQATKQQEIKKDNQCLINQESESSLPNFNTEEIIALAANLDTGNVGDLSIILEDNLRVSDEK